MICLEEQLYRPQHYPLPKVKMFAMTKLNAFADDNLNVAKMMNSVFDRVENIVGNGANAGYHIVFNSLLKDCFLDLTKVKAFADDKMLLKY